MLLLEPPTILAMIIR